MSQLKLLLTFILAIFTFTSPAQICCSKNSADWHALAMNDDFKAAHLAPEPFDYTQGKGSMIQFPIAGDAEGNAYYVPCKKPGNNVLLIFHEYWGLNDYIKQEADRWQKLLGEDVEVYAVDLYDGKVAGDPETAGKYMGSLTQQRGENIIKGVLAKIGKNKKIITLGWCMGGTWSFNATMLAGGQAAGCVMYYGFPEKDKSRIKGLNADVLYIRGSQDNFITAEDVNEFGKKVKATGHKFELHSYDAPHAFANPSNPKHDAKASAEAQELAVKFLKKKL